MNGAVSDPYGLVFPVFRKISQVLHHAGKRAVVGAGAMGQRLVPDDEVAGLAFDRYRTQMLDGPLARRLAGRHAGQPVSGLMLETGHAVKGAMPGRAVR